MKISTCCNHDCGQGRDCPNSPPPSFHGAAAVEVVLWGAILFLFVSPFVG